jgi:hypothetical protein
MFSVTHLLRIRAVLALKMLALESFGSTEISTKFKLINHTHLAPASIASGMRAVKRVCFGL